MTDNVTVVPAQPGYQVWHLEREGYASYGGDVLAWRIERPDTDGCSSYARIAVPVTHLPLDINHIVVHDGAIFGQCGERIPLTFAAWLRDCCRVVGREDGERARRLGASRDQIEVKGGDND